MKQIAAITPLTLALVLGMLSAGEAQNQNRSRRFTRPYLLPNERPVTSPYLQLFQPGRDPAFQYFREVRPEMEFRRSNAQLRRSIDELNQQIRRQQTAAQPGMGLGPTGHAATFMNLGGYFGTGAGGRGGAIGGMGGGGPLAGGGAALGGAGGGGLGGGRMPMNRAGTPRFGRQGLGAAPGGGAGLGGRINSRMSNPTVRGSNRRGTLGGGRTAPGRRNTPSRSPQRTPTADPESPGGQ